LGGGAGDRGCWCQAPRGLVPGGRTAEPGARQDALRHHSRRSGAPGLEAYPIDPGGGRVDVGFGYVGLTPMFEQAGFVRVLETAARSDRRPRILMRLMFDPAPTDPR
ncbi:MAG TPA: hypothetical protein VK194_08760, partial [Candidatus Deferrimicrobium sp.]|nr:hypothetical protein [Candidatus Deferrimicrobium sp.]